MGAASTVAIARVVSDESDELTLTVKASADGGGGFTTLNMDASLAGFGKLTEGLASGSSAVLRIEKALITTISVATASLVEHELDYFAYFG